jgi:hypothetical protein
MIFKEANIPENSVLVLDEAGVLSSAQITLVRDVSVYIYYWIPLCCGLGAAAALLLVLGLLIGIRGDDGTRKRIFDRKFWNKAVPESRVPKVVTIPIAATIAAFLGVGTLASSLFPGISISNFLGLTAFSEALVGIVGSATYTILYLRWVSRCSPDELGRPLALPQSGTQTTTLSFPESTEIASAGTMSFFLESQPDKSIMSVYTGESITIPENTKVEIQKGEAVSFPAGPNIQLMGVFSVLLSNGKEDARLTRGTGGNQPLPVIMTTTADTTITYKNVATVHARGAKFGSKIGNKSMSGRSFTLKPDHLTEPSVSMPVVLTPMLAAALVVGAELGIIGMLSIWLSNASWFGQFVAFDLIVIVALFALVYVVTRFRYATDPDSRPGTPQIPAGRAGT